MQLNVAKNGPKRGQIGTRSCSAKPDTENLILETFKPELQLWPFVRMHSRKNRFANKEVSDVQRNGFVHNSSQMSTDKPKPANINVKFGSLYESVIIIYIAHLKQQKMTKGATH